MGTILLWGLSYPVCQEAPPAPEPSRLYEAPGHKHSQSHHTWSDRETGSRAPGGKTWLWLLTVCTVDLQTSLEMICVTEITMMLHESLHKSAITVSNNSTVYYLVKHRPFPHHMASSFFPHMLDPAANDVASRLRQNFGGRTQTALVFPSRRNQTMWEQKMLLFVYVRCFMYWNVII